MSCADWGHKGNREGLDDVVPHTNNTLKNYQSVANSSIIYPTLLTRGQIYISLWITIGGWSGPQFSFHHHNRQSNQITAAIFQPQPNTIPTAQYQNGANMAIMPFYTTTIHFQLGYQPHSTPHTIPSPYHSPFITPSLLQSCLVLSSKTTQFRPHIIIIIVNNNYIRIIISSHQPHMNQPTNNQPTTTTTFISSHCHH